MTVEVLSDGYLFKLKINGLLKTQFRFEDFVGIQSWIEGSDEGQTFHVNYILVYKKTKVVMHDEFWNREHWEAVLNSLDTFKQFH